MDRLTDAEKNTLRNHGKELEWLGWVLLVHFKGIYDEKAVELLKKDRNCPKAKIMLDISYNLHFGYECIDAYLQKQRELKVELNRAKEKIYQEQMKLDQKDAEIKRLNKLIDKLKKNIEL
jgi:hypothetical protein